MITNTEWKKEKKKNELKKHNDWKKNEKFWKDKIARKWRMKERINFKGQINMGERRKEREIQEIWLNQDRYIATKKERNISLKRKEQNEWFWNENKNLKKTPFCLK